MSVKSTGRKMVFIFLFIISLCGCSSNTAQTDTALASEMTTDTATTIAQPSPTETVLPTPTYEPSGTPTTPPPQPVPLTGENIQNIQRITTVDFFKMGTLSSAAWSPDGKLLVVETNKDLQIVDSETLEILYTIQDYSFIHFLDNSDLVLQNDQGLQLIFDSQSYVLDSIDLEIPSNELGYDVNAYAISNDGKFLADISIANTIKLTNIETGESTEFVYQPDSFKDVEPLGVSFSPDSKYLYFNQGEGLSVFDLESQQLIARESEMNNLPDFSPDSKRLVSLTGKYVSLFTSVLGPWYDLSAWFTSTLNDQEEVYYNWVSYSFVQDSSKLGILYQGTIYNSSTREQRLTATIIIYDTNDGSVVDFINDIPSTTFDMNFSPDGTRFFTLSGDGFIKIWQTSDGELLLTSQSYRPSTAIIVSPDGNQFAYTLGDTLYIFNSRNGEKVAEFTEPNHSTAISMTFQGNDNIAVSSGNQTDTYEIATGEWVRSYPELVYCGFNYSGNVMICSGNGITFFDAITGKTLIQIKPTGQNWYAVSDDGAYTAYCNANSETVFLWDTQKGEQIQFLKKNNEAACGVLRFSPDGQYLAASNGAVWHIPDGDLIMEIPLIETENTTSSSPTVDISPDNEFVLIYPYIYSMFDGSMLVEINPEDEAFYSVKFHPNGYDLIFRNYDTIQFWGVLE